MDRKVIVAVLLVAALPMYAQAQNPKVNKGDAQKVVTIISSDKIKTQTYCDIQKLALQIEEASKKKEHGKTVNELYQKVKTLEENLGPEYVAWTDGLPDIAKDGPARCGVCARSHSTRQAVCELGLKNPNAPAATRVLNGSF
jgi:hypothetical protein